MLAVVAVVSVAAVAVVVGEAMMRVVTVLAVQAAKAWPVKVADVLGSGIPTLALINEGVIKGKYRGDELSSECWVKKTPTDKSKAESDAPGGISLLLGLYRFNERITLRAKKLGLFQ